MTTIRTFPVTGPKHSGFAREGWERLASVEVETWDEEGETCLDNGRLSYAVVWLIGAEGNVYARDILKGETPREVAELYCRRGYTGAQAVLFTPLAE